LLAKQKKEKAEICGQAGGRVAVSDKAGWWRNILTFWMKWIKLMH
jgi:hypothetical protein